MFYRGQVDQSWSPIPSLFRNVNFKEDLIFHDAIKEHYSTFKNETLLGKLTIMQHYAFPTRLLDLTEDPLLGLFFAVFDEYNQSNDKDSAVLVYIAEKDKILNMESDKALIISSFTRLNQSEQSQTIKYCRANRGKIIVESEAERYPFLQKLYHEIKREFPNFSYRIVTDDLLGNYFLTAPKNNVRIKSQTASFMILSGLGVDNLYTDPKPDYKIIIDKRAKKKILEDLVKLSIYPYKAYEDLEYLAMTIKNKF